MGEYQILMQETVETAIEYIGGLLNAIAEIAENIQTGNDEKGIKKSIELADGLKWLIDAITLTGPLQIESGIVIDIKIADAIFVQIIEALENKDFVLLCDLIEYELSPILSGWQESLSTMIK